MTKLFIFLLILSSTVAHGRNCIDDYYKLDIFLVIQNQVEIDMDELGYQKKKLDIQNICTKKTKEDFGFDINYYNDIAKKANKEYAEYGMILDEDEFNDFPPKALMEDICRKKDKRFKYFELTENDLKDYLELPAKSSALEYCKSVAGIILRKTKPKK